MRPPPPPEPVLLPPLSPPTRLDSEIGRMSHAELARWILPAEAGRIVRADLHRGHVPRIGAVSLLTEARPSGRAGLCELRGWTVSLRVPNENALDYRQHLDPPLQPYQYTPLVKWKTAGSTLAAGPAPDCAAAMASGGWFEAPSAESAHRALSLVERAQARPQGVRISCRLFRYDEARQDVVHPPCPDPAALLRQLRPNLVKRVRPADCTAATGASARGCLAVEYDDPASPGTHSFYAVSLADEPRLSALEIVQGMLPPH